jgi:hypothetical protein
VKGPYLRRTFWSFGLLFVLFTSAPVSSQEIKIKVENGVTIVHNPAKPAPPPGLPTRFVLREEMATGNREGPEEDMLLEPIDIDTDDDGNMYVLDSKALHIKVYDSQGHLVRTIGKKGQGPGEFQNPSDIQITPQKEMLVCDPAVRKLLFFRLDGLFLRELSAGKMWLFGRAKIDSKGNVIGSHTIMDQQARSDLIKFSPLLEPTFTIASVPIARYPVFNPYFPLVFYDVTKEDNIVWGITTEYEFRVVNPEGQLLKRILKDHRPERLTKEDQEKRSKEIWGDEPVSSDVRVEWPASFPAFQEFIMDDRGWLLVKTYEKTNDPKAGPYDVFDGEGRYIARVLLAQRPRLWKKGKLYMIEEDEEGYRSVKRYSVEWED